MIETFGIVGSATVLSSGDAFNLICVDLTFDPVELLNLGPCCGEKITEV